MKFLGIQYRRNVDVGQRSPYAISMRCLSISTVLLLCVLVCVAEAKRRPDLQLVVTEDGEHFQYLVAHPERVRKAWIEVLDRPVVIDQKAIDIQPAGEFDWEWNWEPINSEIDDDQLQLGLWDPDGETLTCDGLAIYAQPGGEVAKTVAGGRTRFDPWSDLDQAEFRVMQGSAAFSFDVTGRDLAPGTKLHVFSDKGATCKDEYVRTQLIDLAHAHVTVSSECFREPGVLFLSTDSVGKNYNNTNVWIHVASRASPKLKAVISAPIDEKEKIGQLSLVLRGSNFKKDSDVVASYLPNVGIQGSQIPLDTEYISPTELHATVTTNADDLVGDALGLDHTGVEDSFTLRIWVEGAVEKFELSEPRDLPVRLDQPAKRRILARIASIEPFPIRLMNQHSPKELQITIRGENFIRENKVMAQYGALSETLRTEYVSPTMLHAWIPREHWRKHHVVYRLVVETDKGRKYSREVESKDDE